MKESVKAYGWKFVEEKVCNDLLEVIQKVQRTASQEVRDCFTDSNDTAYLQKTLKTAIEQLIGLQQQLLEKNKQ